MKIDAPARFKVSRVKEGLDFLKAHLGKMRWIDLGSGELTRARVLPQREAKEATIPSHRTPPAGALQLASSVC